jgi:hypothetical protein
MNLNFLKSPRFQKWSLFTSLIASLGFSLSMNPQIANIARHGGVQTMDLAQTAAPPAPPASAASAATASVTPAAAAPAAAVAQAATAQGERVRSQVTAVATAASPSEDPASKMFIETFFDAKKFHNLAEETGDDRLGNYAVNTTLIKNGDKVEVSYLIVKKKSETEGYSAIDCDVCTRKSLAVKGLNEKTKSDLQALIVKIATLEQENLIKAAKADAKKGKKKDGDKSDDVEVAKRDEQDRKIFAEQCRKEDDDNILQCQLDYLYDLAGDCEKGCDSKARVAFKPFEELFRACAKARNGSIVKFKSVEDVDCASAEIMARDMLSDLPSKAAVQKATRFLQASVMNKVERRSNELKKRHVDPQIAGAELRGYFDRLTGSFDMMVPKYENGKYVGMVKTTTELPVPNSYGHSLMGLLSKNEAFKTSEQAQDFFKENFYDSLASTRRSLVQNPMGYTFGDINIDEGLITQSIAEMGKFRAGVQCLRAAECTRAPIIPDQRVTTQGTVGRVGTVGTVMGTGSTGTPLLSPSARTGGTTRTGIPQ